ncbi:MAG: pseudouridine synthase [Acutalibacteraceae bacterium]|nr:pseudouridine synthase [Acutalibacteraceae bacterium]MEE1280840.1 pseudouridine synthase [Acutalibacteraceae bacterium]
MHSRKEGQIMKNNGLVRLQKYMADNGIASRRKSEEMIANGMVKVNGRVATIGDKVNPQRDKVTVKGRKISTNSKAKRYYIMINKPRGYVTTMSDELDRKCVAELVKDIPARVYPVGRLDRDSEGLLLMTNDGEFANKVTHPSKHVYKVYRVTVRPAITEEQLVEMSSGMVIDGRKTAPCEIHVVQRQEGRCVLEIILREGRNRQIRKMCEQVGLEVPRLKRIAIGQVKLGGLKSGSWRELTKEEVHRLQAPTNTTEVDYY